MPLIQPPQLQAPPANVPLNEFIDPDHVNFMFRGRNLIAFNTFWLILKLALMVFVLRSPGNLYRFVHVDTETC